MAFKSSGGHGGQKGNAGGGGLGGISKGMAGNSGNAGAKGVNQGGGKPAGPGWSPKYDSLMPNGVPPAMGVLGGVGLLADAIINGNVNPYGAPGGWMDTRSRDLGGALRGNTGGREFGMGQGLMARNMQRDPRMGLMVRPGMFAPPMPQSPMMSPMFMPGKSLQIGGGKLPHYGATLPGYQYFGGKKLI